MRAGHRPRCAAACAGAASTVALLSVGAVVPRKGYDVLIAALARLNDLPWRLVIAGDCTRSPDTAAGSRPTSRASASPSAITSAGP